MSGVVATSEPLRAPFPWFGGKSLVAPLVWARFGAVSNYVEPFFGSGAVLLGRPVPWSGTETINDKDGFVANTWRAIQWASDEVAAHCDWPVNENDLHSRHAWLTSQRESLRARLEGDPNYYDAKIAGWWIWGISCWIGSSFCATNGPWHVVDGQLVDVGSVDADDDVPGVRRRRVHLGNAGQGVHRQRVHLGDAGKGIHRQCVHLGDAGQGIHRQRVHLSRGQGVHRELAPGTDALYVWMAALSARLRRVRVCCGDWMRVCGPTPTVKLGLTGVFLDPPYSAEAGRDNALYGEECAKLAHDVRRWALAHGADPRLRIALCGYEGEHEMPSSWMCVPWRPQGGYGTQGDGRGRENSHRERIWFSPHCLSSSLFDYLGTGGAYGDAAE